MAFPGAGHIYLKRYGRGMILLVATALGIYLIVHDLLARGLVTQTQALVDKISSGVISPDLDGAENLVNLGPDTLTALVVPWLLLLCWLAGIVDSYRIGRALETAERVGGPPH